MSENKRSYTRLTKNLYGSREPLDPIYNNAVAAFSENKKINNQLEKLIRKENTHCNKCGGELVFKGRGRYTCDKCNEDTYDEFGTVCLYLDAHGPATKIEIAAATGIPESKITRFLKEERLEITNSHRNI